MMFFQVTLFVGYLYAHLLRSLFKPRLAWFVHACVVMSAALALILFRPSPTSVAGHVQLGSTSIVWSIVYQLSMSIGLPFFVLSTTGPLVQAWQATSHRDQSAYRLYALSNLGSMVALLSYPFLIESTMTLNAQLDTWVIGFLLLTVGVFWSSFQTIHQSDWQNTDLNSAPANERNDRPAADDWSAWRIVYWLLLSAMSSIVLLATTNLMSQEVASIPFLWILPLTLYLLSFIVCFERPAFYQRSIWMALMGIASLGSIFLYHVATNAGLTLQIVGFSTVCLTACMICHGELESTKPDQRKLTLFYLVISAGAAFGGIFVSLGAPKLFSGFYEFHLGIGTVLLVSLASIYFQRRIANSAANELGVGRSWLFFSSVLPAAALVIGLVGVMASLMYELDPSIQERVVFRDRNDFGLSTVIEIKNSRRFLSGRVNHGTQSLEEGRALEHAPYYSAGSGIGLAIEGMREIKDQPLKTGVLGLGAGAMSTWLERGDSVRFYEINPMVVEIATKYFSFISDTPGRKTVVVGDGRVELTNELRRTGSHQFDVLVMDAFSSDSIPVHLLTEECFQLYDQHLADDGVLVAHISNHFIDLLPVLIHHGETLGMEMIYVENLAKGPDQLASTWVLLTRNQSFVDRDDIRAAQTAIPEDTPSVRWTDDFSSVAKQLKWSSGIKLEFE